MQTADFRSDTLTRPTLAMREAMASAEVGDDVFGEDPTVLALESEGALALGLEAALYCPTGTMANQIAIHVHCRSGEEVICDRRAHVIQYEAGAIARWTGASVQAIDSGERGQPRPDAVAAAVQPDDVHKPRSRLLVLENTHNMAGGTVMDPVAFAAHVANVRALGLSLHIDGARIANAAAGLGCGLPELTRGADSISMCLSKGLGAPVGSLLAGSAAFVAEARRARKAFGGGMRQAGVIAAAARLALRDGPAQLAVDHRRAERLASACGDVEGLSAAAPDTNIVMVDLEAGDAARLVAHCADGAVQALQVAPSRVRFVTHRDLDEAAVDRAIEVLGSWPARCAQTS